MELFSEEKSHELVMNQKIQIIPSGISFIDRAWGGLYQGATYLLVGAHKSGRTTLALEFVKECVEQKEVCLYFTIRRPKELMLHSASFNFDLQSQVAQKNVIVVKVDSALNLGETRNPDEIFAEYIKDIVGLVEQYQPTKLVFDELTAFLSFKDFNLLEKTFSETIEAIEDFGVTSLFILGDPITTAAKKIVDILAAYTVGVFYLQKKDNNEKRLPSGILAITPIVGHSEGKFKANYSIVPGRGFDFTPQDLTASRYFTNGQSTSVESKYKSLFDIQVPKEEYTISNLYHYEDFKLIINNQIAIYKSTKQPFTLVSFRLEQEAEKNNIISLNQLRNAIRLSVEKKDKICVVSNKVIVLIPKEDQKDITSLISRVKSNTLAEKDSNKESQFKYISVYALRVDEFVSSSDELLKEIRADELAERNKISL